MTELAAGLLFSQGQLENDWTAAAKAKDATKATKLAAIRPTTGWASNTTARSSTKLKLSPI